MFFHLPTTKSGKRALSKTPAPHYERTKAILPLFSRTVAQSSNISTISYMLLNHQKEAIFFVSKYQHIVAPGDLCNSRIEVNELFLVKLFIISDLFLRVRQANEVITRKPTLWLSRSRI